MSISTSITTIRGDTNVPMVIVLGTQNTYQFIIMTFSKETLPFAEKLVKALADPLPDSLEEAAFVVRIIIALMLLYDEVRVVLVIPSVISGSVDFRSISTKSISCRSVASMSVAHGPEASMLVASVAVTVVSIDMTSRPVLNHVNEGITTSFAFAFALAFMESPETERKTVLLIRSHFLQQVLV